MIEVKCLIEMPDSFLRNVDTGFLRYFLSDNANPKSKAC